MVTFTGSSAVGMGWEDKRKTIWALSHYQLVPARFLCAEVVLDDHSHYGLFRLKPLLYEQDQVAADTLAYILLLLVRYECRDDHAEDFVLCRNH